jgi:hypothetical protein
MKRIQRINTETTFNFSLLTFNSNKIGYFGCGGGGQNFENFSCAVQPPAVTFARRVNLQIDPNTQTHNTP